MHPGNDCSRIRPIESHEAGVGCKPRSIDRRDNDRGVTSSAVCVHDEVGYRLAIAGGLLRGLTAGVPWLPGTYGKERLGPNGGPGILMAGWSEVGE